MKKQIEEFFTVKDGGIVTFDVLEWHEDWEFGAPCVIISPVVSYNNDACGVETIIENICMDISLSAEKDGMPKVRYSRESDMREFEWRGWKLKTLRRRFNEALVGKKFPKKNYRATKVKIQFFWEHEDGRGGVLSWEEVKND